VLVPAYNEAGVIGSKLDNLLGLDYPRDRLQLVVVSDGSTDGTNALLEAAAAGDERLTTVLLDERRGKANALNQGLGRATGEIVVFSDSSILLDAQALRAIVKPFADPEVGCVSGEDHIPEGGGEGLYGRYELFLRNRESAVGSIVGASGSFYAERRALCRPFVDGLAPDFLSVLNTVEQGYRAVTEPAAFGFMSAVKHPGDEFRRKVRTLLRGITTLWVKRGLLNPFAPRPLRLGAVLPQGDALAGAAVHAGGAAGQPGAGRPAVLRRPVCDPGGVLRLCPARMAPGGGHPGADLWQGAPLFRRGQPGGGLRLGQVPVGRPPGALGTLPAGMSNNQDRLNSAMDETPFFFPVADQELFGILHRPTIAPNGSGFVFCHPFAEEKLWAHRVYVSLARDLAARGYTVLRFDHMGHGDSDGEFQDASVATHLRDIEAAVGRLREECPGLEEVGLLGLRLGGTFAALSAERIPGIDRLVLWDPVVDGGRYMQEVLRSNLTSQLAAYGKVLQDRKALVESLAEGKPINVDGYELGRDFYEQASAINLLSGKHRVQGGGAHPAGGEARPARPQGPVWR
jgi:exosortase A-associated hydrolase 2